MSGDDQPRADEVCCIGHDEAWLPVSGDDHTGTCGCNKPDHPHPYPEQHVTTDAGLVPSPVDFGRFDPVSGDDHTGTAVLGGDPVNRPRCPRCHKRHRVNYPCPLAPRSPGERRRPDGRA